MYVLCTLEKLVNDKGYFTVTQLAAIRVDEHWKRQEVFSELIEPMDPSFHHWSDPEYTGYSLRDFLTSSNAYVVMQRFQRWLYPDDALCWWDLKI